MLSPSLTFTRAAPFYLFCLLCSLPHKISEEKIMFVQTKNLGSSRSAVHTNVAVEADSLETIVTREVLPWSNSLNCVVAFESFLFSF